MSTIDLSELRPRFRGELITAAGGSRYDAARAVFNGVTAATHRERQALSARRSASRRPAVA